MVGKKVNVHGNGVRSSNEETEWEVRPGGILVQKRSNDALAPELRFRIAYGGLRYEISVSCMSSFLEVKKVLSMETGLQVDEQRLVYRGRDGENGEYLDMCGVKDRSKLVSAIDKSISNGDTVPEIQISTLIEMLMGQAIKLKSISTEGDVSAQNSVQEKKLQKCVETLDALKISNARIKHVVVTTNWETIDHPPSSTKSQWEIFH
ncbi:BAG family molecular chaperone regulator 2-like [Arachis stenosperma]|uniref:BAG family molecular chaperone regulator 2-like n=1 Tax=Arachis stenosperma TaxID=217475 RepID=UPI0025ACEDE0|nr:BAG family molecular chaperone regulator 2-like [Arachis stenosperma]